MKGVIEGRNFSVSICVNMGAYHSTKNFEIFETRTNGTEISRKNFSKIWVYLTRLSSFMEFMQIPNVLYSALASSFGRHHSELDISHKGDAHSIKDLDFRTFLFIFIT